MMPQSLETDLHTWRYRLAGVLIFIWVVIFAITLTGLPDLDNNEDRVGAYVLDAVNHGHWMIQKDLTGDLASKPPMLTWLIGLTTLATGNLSRFSAYLPTALATLAIALVIFAVGWKRMGGLAGFLGGLAYLLSGVTDSQMTTARYDGLFALPVLLAGLAAHRAWVQGRGWTWFWLAAAAATLVKGPLGLLLGLGGLMALVWEWRSGDARRPRGNHLPGIVLYFLICGGWFGLAYLQAGQPLIDKMIFNELVGHSVASDEGAVGTKFYEPLLNLFAKFLPWSLPGALAFWRVWKSPSPDAELRRFERFLVCWIIVGLIAFSISSHQRSRLILPLVPPLALLAGHETARWVSRWRFTTLRNSVAGLTVFALGGLALQRHVLLARDKNSREALALYEMAGSIRARVGSSFPLTHLHTASAIQFCLGSYRPFVTEEEAADLLRGESAAFVVVEDLQALREELGAETEPLHILMERKTGEERFLRIVSNHPRLEWAGSVEALFGSLRVRMEGARLVRQKGNRFDIEFSPAETPVIRVSNGSKAAQHVEITLHGSGKPTFHQKLLAPGASWQL